MSSAPLVPAGDLLRDTAVAPVPGAPGRYRSELSGAWRVLYAFGGATFATALRAIEAELGRDDLELRSATATYCSPVPCGPVTTDVEVLRNGRSAAQAVARLRAGEPDDPPAGTDLLVTAVHGADHPSEWAFTDVSFPGDVPPPDRCPGRPEVPSPFAGIPYHQQIEWRPAVGHRPGERDWQPGPARGAAWFRFRVPPLRPDGRLEPAALAVPGDSLGHAVGEGLGPDRRWFLVLSLQITLERFADPGDGWILQDVHAEHCADGYASGTTVLWDERGTLLARFTQRAHLRPFPAG